MKINISASDLEHYVVGRPVLARGDIPQTFPVLRASRLQDFLERYDEHLTVYVCGNRFYYCHSELASLIDRIYPENQSETWTSE